MHLSEKDIKTINDMMVELITHRRLEDEERITDDNGLYSDEAELAAKLGLDLS